VADYPEIAFGAYGEALGRLRELEGAVRDAEADFFRLRGTRRVGVWADGTPRFADGELTAAVAADEVEAAEALRLGRPAPKTRRADRVRAQIVEADVRLGVARRALAGQHDEVARVLAEHAPEVGEVLADAAARAGVEYAAAVEALAVARDAFWAAQRVGVWAAAAERRGDGTLAGFTRTTPPLPLARGVTTTNGEPLQVEPVLDMFRAEVNPPAPERRPVRYETKHVEDRAPNGAVLSEGFFSVPVYDDEPVPVSEMRFVDGVPFFAD
jgi:hypothetical protein